MPEIRTRGNHVTGVFSLVGKGDNATIALAGQSSFREMDSV